MSRVRFNILANISGQAWVILLAIVATPFYIRLLGIEAYGLVAFYIVLQSVLQLLDLGLGATVSREIARSAGAREAANGAELARFLVTLERWYWGMAVSFGVLLFLTLPAISAWWLRPEHLKPAEMTHAARVFALLALVQWPITFYQCGLMGLQRQVAINAIQMPFTAIAHLGGVVFVWLGPRSVAALLAWHAGTLACQLVVLYLYFWANVGVSRQGVRGGLDVLRKHWRFSLGMSGIALTGLVLTHLDKIILSRLLPLQIFGHYSLAATISRGLYVLITPVFNAYFPRLSSLVAQPDPVSVRVCYRTATNVMAVLVLPLAALVAAFSEEILLVWLRDAALAASAAPLASLLVAGTCLNGLMNVPFALQLAHGNTRIGLTINAGLLVVLVPAIVYATGHFGASGGAAMWLAANALNLLVGLPVTHKHLLHGGLREWALEDVLPPAAASIAVVVIARLLYPPQLDALASLAGLATLWALATLAALLSSRRMRRWGQDALRGALRA
jgi:O-antigen/teichoic acid export membrane protein